jgi:hypothetical protein
MPAGGRRFPPGATMDCVRRTSKPAVITDARRSQHDQLRRREVRYVLMMSFRAVSLLAAAILVGVHAPLLWLWIPICLFGMVVVPWLAVIIANDAPPKEKYRFANRLRPAEEPAPRPQPALPPAPDNKVIDVDP